MYISETADPVLFKKEAEAYQAGHTSYPAFCSDAAGSGVEKWAGRMDSMTCTYFDIPGNQILVKKIPG